jgi:hypothetical protein
MLGALLSCQACGAGADATDTIVETRNDRDSEPASATVDATSDVPEPDPLSEQQPIPGVALLDVPEGRAAQRDVYWYTFDDRKACGHPDFAAGQVTQCGATACAASGTMVPLPEANGGTPFETSAFADSWIDEPPLQGQQTQNPRGFHVQANGYVFLGAGMGVRFGNDAGTGPYDLEAHGFDAVRFVARSGISSSTIPLALRVADVYSDPEGGLCQFEETTCDANGCSCDGARQGCLDHPTAPLDTLEVDNKWRVFEVSLGRFARAGTGRYENDIEAPRKLDPAGVYALEFFVPSDGTPTREFDLWIDDIGFTVTTPAP